MRVFFADSAISDLQEIVQYYEEQFAPQVGQKFVVDIIKRVETLPANPGMGRVVPEFATQKIRELVHPPFRIVYVNEQSGIYIIRVWRSERLLILPKNPE